MNWLFSFLSYKKQKDACPWTLLDVLAFTALIALFIFFDPFHLGMNVLKFLRLHFFIFTKEPKLFYSLNIYINTIILKAISFVLLILLIKLHKVNSWDSVVSSGRIPKSWDRIGMPLFIAACVVAQTISVSNPLVPNIPYNSVFTEAKIIGNLVIIFSVLFVAPFVEEVLFRGFLYPALNKYMGIFPSIILTSALFTLAHYSRGMDEYSFLAIIFVFSLVITYARAVSGSTKLAIIMHQLYNLISIGVGFVDYLIYKY